MVPKVFKKWGTAEALVWSPAGLGTKKREKNGGLFKGPFPSVQARKRARLESSRILLLYREAIKW
jgi:hypothetical protein